jgi:hypothetical protein
MTPPLPFRVALPEVLRLLSGSTQHNVSAHEGSAQCGGEWGGAATVKQGIGNL